MSTDAFLKSVKKFLDKEVRITPFLKQPLAFPHHTPVICYVLFHDARLYFWNRLPDYFASAREAYKSLACRNLCTITLLLLCPDTGPAVRILGNIGESPLICKRHKSNVLFCQRKSDRRLNSAIQNFTETFLFTLKQIRLANF